MSDVQAVQPWATGTILGADDDIPLVIEGVDSRHAPAARGQDWFADVLAFHQKFGCKILDTPGSPGSDTQALRIALIDEEVKETYIAMAGDELPGIADGIVDSIYVLIGAAISHGIDIRPVWAAVHAANMAKEGGGTRADGKILKPPGWTAPDVAGILARQPPIPGGVS